MLTTPELNRSDGGGAQVPLALDETKGLASALPGWAGGPDLLVAECGFFDHDPDGRTIVPPFWPMRRTEASWETDTLPLVRAVGARRTLLVHLMGCLTGRTPDELDALAAARPELRLAFAHDGVTVVVL